jgi:hypothetical protein
MSPDLAAIIRRWAYCRCTHHRAPTDPCVCTPADISRAERESRVATRRWDDQLWARRQRES